MPSVKISTSCFTEDCVRMPEIKNQSAETVKATLVSKTAVKVMAVALHTPHVTHLGVKWVSELYALIVCAKLIVLSEQKNKYLLTPLNIAAMIVILCWIYFNGSFRLPETTFSAIVYRCRLVDLASFETFGHQF